MKQKLIQILIILFILISLLCFGHSGRTDSSGGHHDRIHGGYHYHNGGSKGNSSNGLGPIIVVLVVIFVGYLLYKKYKD